MNNLIFNDDLIFLKKHSFVENKIITIDDYNKLNKSYCLEYKLNNNIYIIRNNYINHYFIKKDNYIKSEIEQYKISNLFKIVNIDANNSYKKRKIRNIEIKNYYYSFFNIKNINKIKSNKIIGIDINSCYWNTAHNLGIITKNTYDYGIENTNKLIRNATIGSFNSNIILNKYDYENIIETKIMKRKIHVLRNEIIYYVYKIAYNIQRLLKEDFLFFYVDCFYIKNNENSINKLCRYLEKNNYEYKFKNVELIEFIDDDSNYIMNWINSKGEKVKNYINESQIIES